MKRHRHASLLELKDIRAGYDALEVLKGIDVEVFPSEIVALIGPNGAGKSTVIKSVFGIANLTHGSIHFRGKDITHMKTHKLISLGISYVPQGKINFSNLTVKQNLEIGAHHIKDKRTIEKNMKEVFRLFPVLKERQHDLSFGLSGGQQQMLAIGRALMSMPSLLLLDEPSLGLSPKLQKQVFGIIRTLRKKGISCLIVEQNAKKAIEMADRTYLLEDGKIALSGKDIFDSRKLRKVYLGSRY